MAPLARAVEELIGRPVHPRNRHRRAFGRCRRARQSTRLIPRLTRAAGSGVGSSRGKVVLKVSPRGRILLWSNLEAFTGFFPGFHLQFDSPDDAVVSESRLALFGATEAKPSV